MSYVPSALRRSLLFAFAWLRLIAADVSLEVSSLPSPATLGQPLTYTLALTNLDAFPLINVTVTNTLSGGFTVLGATNSAGSVTTNLAGGLQFLLPLLNFGQGALLGFSVQPTAAGSLTNVVTATVVFTNAGTTNTLALTNFTRVFAGDIDLEVGLSGPTYGILTNDLVSYQLAVTNLGPQTATGVTLTNYLPSGATVQSVSPAGQLYSVGDDGLVFALDSLAAGASQQMTVNLQFDNPGSFVLSAAAVATNYYEGNTINNSSALTVTVDAALAADLGVTFLTAQGFNPQTGLMEQKVRLTNNGTNATPGERVFVAGLTNTFYNAVGTNGGVPFVILTAGLAPGASVDLLLEYIIPTRQAGGDPVLSALAVPAYPAVVPTGDDVAITRVLLLAADAVLLEFPATNGLSYTIVYSDDISFANPRVARPPVVAPADRVQWIDHGPPDTAASPSNAPTRFYRVIANP